MNEEQILAAIESEVSNELRGVSPPDTQFRRIAEEYVSNERVQEQWTLLWDSIGLEPGPDLRLMELGCGFGRFITHSNDSGVPAVGIEPSEERLAVAYEVLSNAGYSPDLAVHGVGETMPFEDNAFDVVFSTNVLEHVQNLNDVIAETVRVLKPGGYAHHIVPNFGSWWEGHYGVLWLPNTPAWLGKLYVRLLGRDPAFVDTLQLVNYRKLVKALKPFEDEIEIIDWGQDLWEHRVRSMDFSAWSTLARLKRLLDVAHKLGLISLIVFFGRRLRWETPIVLTIRKKPQ